MQKMIHCKACGKEIAKSAKACPHCGAKAKPGCLRTVLAVFLIFIGIGLIAGALSDDEGPVKVPSESQSVAQTTQPTEEPVFTVGDTATMDDIYVTLVEVHEYDGKYLEPEEGNTFVAFELLIENKSDEDIVVSSLMCFEAYFDDFSKDISLGAETESGMNTLDGTVAAGKKMSGAIAYEVPNDWQTAELRFNPDWGNKEFVFTYSK